MNQNEFFNILMDGLKDFPETKLQNIISYYENNFTLRLASGKTEEEIITELGDPHLIVNRYRNEDSKTPINSSHNTPISNKNSSNNSNVVDNKNFINYDGTYTQNPNIVTNDIYNDFKTTDNFTNDNSTDKENDLETNSKLNTLKIGDSHDCIDLNDTFYDLNNSNTSVNGTKSNSNSNNEQTSDTFANNFTNQNPNKKVSYFNVNTILRICIAFLTLIIFFPVITGVIGCIIGLFGIAISILVASTGLLVGGTFTSFIGLPNVPMFVANFPYPVIVLFSLGSISLSILLILFFYYLCKFCIQISIRIYHSLKSQGGAL